MSAQILYLLVEQRENDIWIFLMRFVFYIILLIPIYKVKALGAGDVKLLAMSSCNMPIQIFFFYIFSSLIFGVIQGIVKKLFCLISKKHHFNLPARKVHFTISILASYLFIVLIINVGGLL